MFTKVLLLVDDRSETARAIELALHMAKLCDARVFAAWVLPAPAATQVAPAPVRVRRRRKPEPGTQDEEHAWSRLYEIEDDAFEENVKISLLLETGNRDERLLALIDSYQLDALIIGARSATGWESLLERSPKTVLLVR